MLKKAETFDIIFEAVEDLYNNSKTQVLLLKSCYKTIQIAKPRNFQSYCYEFCGIVGVSFNTVRFLIGGRDVNPDLSIMSNCHVKVLHTAEFNLQPANSLKAAFVGLLNQGTFSDVILNINGEAFHCHKCILVSRSAKFEGMFGSMLKENVAEEVEIFCKRADLYKLMLTWIYCGEIKFPDDLFDIFELMLLADEYLIGDLKQKCEEDMFAKIDETNVLSMLMLTEKHPLVGSALTDKCKTVFIEEFDKVAKLHPDLEKQITSVPGLMVKLFSHIHSKKNIKRRVTFVVES